MAQPLFRMNFVMYVCQSENYEMKFVSCNEETESWKFYERRLFSI